jgi:hypothetical protein
MLLQRGKRPADISSDARRYPHEPFVGFSLRFWSSRLCAGVAVASVRSASRMSAEALLVSPGISAMRKETDSYMCNRRQERHSTILF